MKTGSFNRPFIVLILLFMYLTGGAMNSYTQEAFGGKKSTLTFIGNTGYLIAFGDRKVLIDAPFINGAQWGVIVPSRRTLGQITRAESPFNDIDLVLISHNHKDHYEKNMLVNCLKNNPKAVLIAPEDVIKIMRKSESEIPESKSRLLDTPLQRGERKKMKVQGIELEIFAGSHHYPDNNRLVHYSYLIHAGKKTVFHSSAWTADHPKEVSLFESGLERIDIALLHYFMMDKNKWSHDSQEKTEQRRRVIKDLLRPEKIVLHHIYENRKDIPYLKKLSKEIKKDFPDIVVFDKSMQSLEW